MRDFIVNTEGVKSAIEDYNFLRITYFKEIYKSTRKKSKISDGTKNRHLKVKYSYFLSLIFFAKIKLKSLPSFFFLF